MTALLMGFFNNAAQAKPEDWYVNIGMGLAETSYPKTWENVFDSWGDSSSSFRIRLSRDLGFYFPLASSTVWGVAVTDASDAISNDQGGTFGIDNYLFGLSVLSFMGSEPGDGFFARADFGRGAVQTSNVPANSTSIDFSSVGSGTGYLLGFGYGMPTGPGTRILFSISFQTTQISGDQFSASRLSAGVLF